MNPAELKQRLAKLPAWAQQYIAGLERQHRTAIEELQRHLDDQTPSPFYTYDLACLSHGAPTNVRRYFQCRHIAYEHRGLMIDITPRELGVTIQYRSDQRLTGEVLCIPTSFQQFELRYPK